MLEDDDLAVVLQAGQAAGFRQGREHVVFVGPQIDDVPASAFAGRGHEPARPGGEAAVFLAKHRDPRGPGLHQGNDDPLAAADEDLAVDIGVADGLVRLGIDMPSTRIGFTKGKAIVPSSRTLMGKPSAAGKPRPWDRAARGSKRVDSRSAGWASWPARRPRRRSPARRSRPGGKPRVAVVSGASRGPSPSPSARARREAPAARCRPECRWPRDW